MKGDHFGDRGAKNITVFRNKENGLFKGLR